VLSAIQFDDESPFDACEIHEERSDRMLPSKLATKQSAVAQEPPHPSFGISRFSAEMSRVVYGCLDLTFD